MREKIKILCMLILLLCVALCGTVCAEEYELQDMKNIGAGVEIYTIMEDLDNMYESIEIESHDFETYPYYDWVTLRVACDNDVLYASGNIKVLYQYSEYWDDWMLIKTSSCDNYEEIWRLEGFWGGKIHSIAANYSIIMEISNITDTSMNLSISVYCEDRLCGREIKTVYYNKRNHTFSFEYTYISNWSISDSSEILSFNFDKNGVYNIAGANSYKLSR